MWAVRYAERGGVSKWLTGKKTQPSELIAEAKLVGTQAEAERLRDDRAEVAHTAPEIYEVVEV